MNNRTITITLSLLVLGVFAVTLIFFQSFRVQIEDNTASVHDGVSDIASSSEEIAVMIPKDPLVMYYTFAEDTHTIRGEVIVPTSCTTLISEAIVFESYPERVTIRLTTRDDSEEEGIVCENVPTARSFRVIFGASAEAVITATLDRVPVEISLVEDTEDTDLE